jgi:single-stranded-DNA-specific exonuclease
MNYLYSEFSDDVINSFAAKLHVSPLVAFLLLNRGVDTLEQAEQFLSPSLNQLQDPFQLKDMDVAVDRIAKAVSAGEKIMVYGDEDVDGICSTVIVYKTLKNLGGQVSYLIPNKKRDGIGLREKFLIKCHKAGISLIITVDCGTTNFSQVEYATELGIDVIITDHHETLNELPKAVAVVNPKRKDSEYAFKRLAGAGVAYKVSQAIAVKLMNLSASQWFSVQSELLSLVLLGTVGDRVPLTDENRIFIKFGLEVLKKNNFLWAQVILDKYPAAQKSITMSTILTHFIPLLSAGESADGRNIGCELLLSADINLARGWVEELFSLSQDWFLRARNAFSKIKANLNISKNINLLLLIEHETEVDVLSYCASKLKDLIKKPVIMIGFKDDCVIGEARAPKGYNLLEYLKECDDLFIDYGGHKCAAGFSVQPQNLSATIEKLNETAAQFPPNSNIVRTSNAEIQITTEELRRDIVSDVILLSPFGEGNPPPLFKLENVEIKKYYDGYRLSNCSQSFWATRRIRHQLNFPIGVTVAGNVEFFIEDTGRGYISRVNIFSEENAL